MLTVHSPERDEQRVVARKSIMTALVARLDGPGGYYNIGNILGLTVGLGVQISLSGEGAAAATLDYLMGSPAALCITIATLVFTVSGEAYHRAWANGAPPVGWLNVQGDILSGVGALWLGLALFLLGQPLLAATAGLMHAFGKFGSALMDRERKGADRRGLFYRKIVLFSRLPALVAMAIGLAQSVQQANIAQIILSATLITCYLLWAKADILLMKP